MKLDERFNTYRHQLGETDMLIWNYIQKHRATCSSLSIEQLGAKCNVSRTTILRFAKKLDYHGYRDLRVCLEMESGQEQLPPDPISQTCTIYKQAIDEISTADYTQLLRLIDESENLYICSSGMVQDAVANEMRRMFLSADKWFYPINGPSEGSVMLENLTRRDLVVMLSLSGESRTIVELAHAVKVRNVPLVSITQLRDNTLAQISDIQLYITTISIQQQKLQRPYLPTTSFFILIELLYLKYLEYLRKKEKEHDPSRADRTKLPQAER